MAILFSKKLNKTDIKHRLSVKSSSLTSFPPFEDGNNYQDLKVEVEGGKEWFFKLIIRKRGYKKPVISAGWRNFVTEKKLEIGDEIVFLKELDEATGVKYKVSVMKQVKQLGEVTEVKDKIRVKKPVKQLDEATEVKKTVKLFNVIIGHAPYPHIN